MNYTLKLYVVKVPSGKWLLLSEGSPDKLYGEYNTRREAYIALDKYSKEV